MGGVRGREVTSRMFVVGVGNKVAVASDTVEKSGQGLDDGGTGTFGFLSRSGRQVWLWFSSSASRSGMGWGFEDGERLAPAPAPVCQKSCGHRRWESGGLFASKSSEKALGGVSSGLGQTLLLLV